MINKLNHITKQLEDLKENNLYKEIKEIESAIETSIIIKGKPYINFASNNYLGLANNNKLKKAAIRAITKYGVGPAAVRTIAGTQSLHLELEKRLSLFKKCEAVITFQGGLLANLATIPIIAGEEDIIFSDELNHASIIDGCRLSKAKVIRYPHGDIKALEILIKNEKKYKNRIIITDGVFSMDGDIAPLDRLYSLAEKYNAILYVDDAHGEGVLGENGRGVVDHFKLHNKVDIEVGTLSKAFGVVGGFVAGKRQIVDLLRQKARPFLFSSAMTPGDTGAAIEAVKLLYNSNTLVKKLWANADFLKKELSNLGFDTGHTQTPIIPLMLGDVSLAKEFSNMLFAKGIFVVPIGYPTVAMDRARIRIMVSAAHTKSQLIYFIKTVSEVGKKLKVI